MGHCGGRAAASTCRAKGNCGGEHEARAEQDRAPALVGRGGRGGGRGLRGHGCPSLGGGTRSAGRLGSGGTRAPMRSPWRLEQEKYDQLGRGRQFTGATP